MKRRILNGIFCAMLLAAAVTAAAAGRASAQAPAPSETAAGTQKQNPAEPQGEKEGSFLDSVGPSCYRIKGFGILDGSWQQIDVAAGRTDYKPCADQGTGRLVFISRIGIRLIRQIKDDWDRLVQLPVTLHN